MSTTVKYSRQREAIKNYLMGRKDHPTAEMIYNAVREQYPNISLGTVYRNLTFLADRGEIIKFSCGEESERFDARTDNHYHFICTKCKSVMDIEMLSLDIINDAAKSRFDGEIEGHMIYFYGKCKSCMDVPA